MIKSINMNFFTFGKYKGRLVSSILETNPRYWAWCVNNIKGFKFSKRDYEIFLTWLSVCNNNRTFALGGGYVNERGIMKHIFYLVHKGEFNEYSDTEYLTRDTYREYLKNNKHYIQKKKNRN